MLPHQPSGQSSQDKEYDMLTHKLRMFRIAGAVLVVTVGLPTPTWAFGKQGHRIVGRIAEAHLTPEARAAVDKLLGEGKRLSDDDVANWADHIRNDFPETGPWHYVDIPFDKDEYDPARDCKYSDCVIARIERFREVLADKSAKPVERQRALKFLVHFVGDMHQPLHCAERRDSKGTPDKGGNLCMVRFLSEPEPINLHRVWDYKIIEHKLGDADPLQYADELNGRFRERAPEWRGGTVEQWALQSFRAAKAHVYAGVAADGAPTHLDEKYVANGQRVTDEQLMKAGIRLAEILNGALK
jgi:hypothetical protein